MVRPPAPCNNQLMKQQTIVESASMAAPLDALPVFLAVARLRSFSAAATQLNLDRSRVSRIIASLEERLGAALFTRTTRHVRLTPEGLELQGRVAPAMVALTEAFARLDHLADHAVGTVSLTTSPDLARYLVAPHLPSFRQAHPQIRVVLHTSDALLDLTTDNVDLALRLGRPGPLSGVARRLTTLSAAFFASPTYLERRGFPRSLAELSHHETLWPDPPRKTAAFGAESTSSVAPASVSADFGTLAAIARAGGGLALLPTFLAQDDLANGRLVRVLDAPGPPTPLYLVSRPERPQPPRVRALQRHLIAALSHRA